MRDLPKLGAAVLTAAFIAVPALAATGTNSGNTVTNPTTGTTVTTQGPYTGQASVTKNGNNNANAAAGTNGMNNANHGVLANNNANTNNNGVFGNANNNNNANGAVLPHQRNPLLADNGDARAGKVIGTDVYNKADKKIGTVDDILMNKSGAAQAVISTNGKLVLVPWNKLEFGNAKANGDNKVIMPDETQAALNGMQQFHYTAQGG